LKVPKFFKINCGVAFGYAKKYPDVKTAIHGKRKVMRGPLKEYIWPKNK